MTSALREIVDAYELEARRQHVLARAWEDPLHRTEFDECEACEPHRSLISRARAELERGVDVRRLVRTFLNGNGGDKDFAAMEHALRAQGVRVVEDGKESA